MAPRYPIADPASAPLPRQPVGLIFAALLLVLGLAMLYQTIVLTALPTIVGDLGGLEHLSWVVTAYLLSSTVVTPIYGKLGDMFGRKIVLQAATVIFIIGSALSGVAQDMTQLIVFRAVHGLGGGGLIVVTMAVIADIVPPRDRGKYQGMFGAVYGLATIVGPLLGGFIVDNLSWHWIFFANIPLAVVALVMITVAFTAPTVRTKRKIDYRGAVLLAVALTAIVLFTSLGGTTYDWGSPEILAIIAVGVLGTAAFIWAEARATEPIMPLSLFRNATFSLTSAISFIVGLSLFGAVMFLPLYLQVVKGVNATNSGLQLLPMMVGMLVTSIGSGILISRTGRYRIFPIFGTAIVTLAMVLLTQLGVDTAQWRIIANMVLLGLGLGLVMQVLILAAQNAVDPGDVGVATAGSTFFRQIGGSIGLSLFGAIFATRLADGVGAAALPADTVSPDTLSPRVVAGLPSEALEPVLHAFTDALQGVFLTAAGISVVAVLLTWFLKEAPVRSLPSETDVKPGDSEAAAAPVLREPMAL